MDDDWDIGFAYLARCCYELKLKKEFNIYLRQAVERNPEESIEVLSDLYPEGTSPQDYPNIRIL
jgi:LMP1